MSPLRQCPQCGEPFAGAGSLCLTCRKKQAAPAEPPAPQPLLRSGDRFQELEILGDVGQGGMGVVYRARQIRLDRVVALKIIRPEQAGSVDLQSRFEREAKVLASLQHPNIVQIFDLGKKDQIYYIVMEFVDGTTLRDRTRRGICAPPEAAGIVEQICRALEYAHAKGVVHRDIKPENILLDKDGQAKVTDFGLAKMVGAEKHGATLTASGAVLGTMAYMAPEQWEGSPSVDGRADLYSTGAVLYELLTGKIPQGRIEDPTQGSSSLGKVVLRAMERDPEKRYQTAADLRSDLIQSTAPATVTRIDSRPSHRRLTRWILAAAAILLVAGVGVVWRLTRPKEKPVDAPPSSHGPTAPKRSPQEILAIGEREGPPGEKWGLGSEGGWRAHGEANPLVTQEKTLLYKLARYVHGSLRGEHFSESEVRWGFLAQWTFLDYAVLDVLHPEVVERDLKKLWRGEELWCERRENWIVIVVRYRGGTREAFQALVQTAQGKLALLDRRE